MKSHASPVPVLCGLILGAGLSSWAAAPDDKSPTPPLRPSSERGAYSNSIHELSSQEFVTEAVRCGRREIHCAGIAVRRSGDPAVRKFAETLVQQHTDATRKLVELADRKGLTVPSTNSWDHVANAPDLQVNASRYGSKEPTTPSPTQPTPVPQSDPAKDKAQPAEQQPANDAPAVVKSEESQDNPHRKDPAYRDKLEKVPSAEFDQAFLQATVEEHAVAIRMFESAAKQLTDSDLRNYASETLPALVEHQKQARQLARERNLELSRSEPEENDPSRTEKTRGQGQR